MPRGPRLRIPGGLYHIIAWGRARRPIFLQRSDYRDFLSRLEKGIRFSDYRCYAWVLMPDHFHLLVHAGENGTPPLMRRLMTGYAGAFNQRHRRAGRLFQSRYKAILCEKEPYLLELVRYI